MNINIRIHGEIQAPQSGFLSSFSSVITGLMGKKVTSAVHLVGKKNDSEVFKHAVGEGFVPKDEPELKELLHSHEWIVIPNRFIENLDDAKKLTPQETIAVRVSDLVNLGLNPNILQRLKEEEQATALTLLQIHRQVTRTLETDEIYRQITRTLVEKWSAPIEPTTLEKVRTFTSSLPKISLTDQQREKLLPERTGGSFTITDYPEKRKDWSNAELFMREKAEKGEALSIPDLCHVHRLLFGKDAEELEAGKLREEGAICGNLRGPAYVRYKDIPQMMTELMDWIETGIQRSLRGEENIIVVAALAYQRMVSIHPFTDGNGRLCRLVMDYVFMRGDLIPPALGKNVEVAIFGDQEADISHLKQTPTLAVEKVLEGLERSYTLMREKE